MPSIAEILNEIASTRDEVEERTKRTVEEILDDYQLISVDRVGNANMDDSVKIKLDYSAVEEVLEESDELDDLNVSLSGGNILQIQPEGNENR